MKTVKRMLPMLLSAILVVALSVTCLASGWSSYFGYDDEESTCFWEGSKGTVEYSNDRNFKVNMELAGWNGVWGGQVWKSINVVKGKQYRLSFTMKSTKVNKYVYVKLSEREFENVAFSFWVYLPRGEEVVVDKTFTAATTTDTIAFGLGGDFGDRMDEYDRDSSYRYKVFEDQFGMSATKLYDLDCEGDSAVSSSYIVSDFLLDDGSGTQPETTTVATTAKPAPVINKAINNNTKNASTNNTVKVGKVKIKSVKSKKKSVSLSWKKVGNATGYQVKVGSITKKTSKTSLTVKVKKSGKYSVKVRAYAGSKPVYGSWSKAQTVKVKASKK